MKKDKCSSCGGTGGTKLVRQGREIIPTHNQCTVCKGTGQVELTDKTFKLGKIGDGEIKRG